MSPWKRICCAVDLSEVTEIVVQQAAALAGWIGAELVLLHVVTPPPPSAVDMLPSDEDGRELEGSARSELEFWREEARRSLRRPVAAFESHGPPAKEILRFAEEHGVEAIVLGTHGRRGFERLVLGSVAEQVMRQARCPVVVVHPASGVVPIRKVASAGVYEEV
jgi:universal stress protein A